MSTIALTSFRWKSFPFQNNFFSILVLGGEKPNIIRLSRLIFYILNLYPEKRFGPHGTKIEGIVNLDYDELAKLSSDYQKTIYMNFYQMKGMEEVPFKLMDSLFVKDFHLLTVAPSFKDIPLSWLNMFSLIFIPDMDNPEIPEIMKRVIPNSGKITINDTMKEGLVIANNELTPTIYIYPEQIWNEDELYKK